MSGDLYNAARVVLAAISARMTECGLETPGVLVARQGTAADDGCPCEGRLAAIWTSSLPADGAGSFQPVAGVHRLGAPCIGRIEDSFRVRYTRCWPAVARNVGGVITLPTSAEVDEAARVQLLYLSAFQAGLYGGAWAADLPASLAYEEWRVSRVDPVTGTGCAGWQALVTFSHDLGI